ncbi:50S ribosomal protein L29 [bacterium]|nr:50S ribosomal protein L29 [bacterium]MCP5463252.1 50S ribosomal protein L29 [bacterium]
MKAKEIRSKNLDEKRQLLNEYKLELFNLRIQKKTGQIEKIGRIRVVKKEIARLLTVLNESNN